MPFTALGRTLWSTASAVLGDVDGLFHRTGPIHAGTLEVSDEGPGGTQLLRPGTRNVLVRCAPVSSETTPRTLCIKVPDAYGPGADQDFLLATSGDGAPLHHAVVATSGPGAHLYSSLWLYLAGLTPVAFGARTAAPADRMPAVGDRIEFLVSGVLSRFHPVGTITLEREVTSAHITFAANNAGGGLRAMPPALLYRG
jgi:hypothetical protein